MNQLRYECMRCGICCFELSEKGKKRIPLYPEEVERLITLAEDKKIIFQVIEDLVFPDTLNQKILVLTYKILLNNEKGCCPFYNSHNGCTIQDLKPFACQAYPLSLKRIDAFNFEISIDPLCNFVKKNYDRLSNIDFENIKTIFYNEYPKAEKFYNKNKRLQMKIKTLEYEKKILIPREISLDDFNKYLNEWEREEITVE
jgi:Fe-S-cluster containining protein